MATIAFDLNEYKVSQVRDFNPDTGESLILTFAGDLDKMEEIADYYEVAGSNEPLGYGYKTNLHQTAAGVILTVRIPESILYTERWQLATETTHIPIWRNQKVKEFLPNSADIDLNTQEGLRTWLRYIGYLKKGVSLIEQGQDPDQAFSGGETFSAEGDKLMFLIIREGEYQEWKRPVLKRVRVIPSVNVSERTRLVGMPTLYSLDDIASEFGIPDDIYDQAVTVYEDLPTAPPDTSWSWKLGRDDSEGIIGAAKVQECREWTFGLWSTITNIEYGA